MSYNIYLLALWSNVNDTNKRRPRLFSATSNEGGYELHILGRESLMNSYNTAILRGHGIHNVRYGVSGVNSNSRVVASITEVTDPGGQPFLGDASLSVLSVAATEDNIFTKVYINWDNDLNYRITLFVDP